MKSMPVNVILWGSGNWGLKALILPKHNQVCNGCRHMIETPPALARFNKKANVFTW